MSTSATAAVGKAPPQSGTPTAQSLRVRLFLWGISLPVAGFLLYQVVDRGSQLIRDMPQLAGWLLIVVIADLMPVRLWREVRLTMSLPVLLAAATAYPPAEVGLLAFMGSVDARELRGEVRVSRAIFNRSQIAISVMGASAVFRALDGNVREWPLVFLPTSAALATDFVTNALLVTTALRLATRLPFKRIFVKVYAGFPPAEWLAFGFVAVLLAVAFEYIGSWGLASFLVPLTLARQMFAHRAESTRALAQAGMRAVLLTKLSERIADERRDERLRVASGLHDEILQALYKVHLMGQVLRRDLESGRLLDLEEDLPELLEATDRAADGIRLLIRDLRTSSLGVGGLVRTLEVFTEDLFSKTGVKVHADLEDVRGLPMIELVAYQVAKEALQNVAKHSTARNVWVHLSRESGHLQLVIADDGCGFDPLQVDQESHFGLQMMRERVELSGGTLKIDSWPGEGTRVEARLPLQE